MCCGHVILSADVHVCPCDGQTMGFLSNESIVDPIHPFTKPSLAPGAPFELSYGNGGEGRVPDFQNNPIAACSPGPNGRAALFCLGAAGRVPYTPA